MQEQGEAGIAQIRQGLAACAATRSSVRAEHFALLAEAYGYTGQSEVGLATLAEAFAVMDKTGQRVWEARLHQLKGELLFSLKAEIVRLRQKPVCTKPSPWLAASRPNPGNCGRP